MHFNKGNFVNHSVYWVLEFYDNVETWRKMYVISKYYNGFQKFSCHRQCQIQTIGTYDGNFVVEKHRYYIIFT